MLASKPSLKCDKNLLERTRRLKLASTRFIEEQHSLNGSYPMLQISIKELLQTAVPSQSCIYNDQYWRKRGSLKIAAHLHLTTYFFEESLSGGWFWTLSRNHSSPSCIQKYWKTQHIGSDMVPQDILAMKKESNDRTPSGDVACSCCIWPDRHMPLE